jgi:hypothetical protein
MDLSECCCEVLQGIGVWRAFFDFGGTLRADALLLRKLRQECRREVLQGIGVWRAFFDFGGTLRADALLLRKWQQEDNPVRGVVDPRMDHPCDWRTGSLVADHGRSEVIDPAPENDLLGRRKASGRRRL